MDKELLQFLNRETNAISFNREGCKLIISRELVPNGCEHYYQTISFSDREKDIVLKDYWVNPEKTKKKEKSNYTGGKKPYIMIMVEEIEKLRDSKVTNIEELIGYMVCVGKYIEWNTGKLIHRKGRKRNQSLKYEDLLSIYSCSKPKLNKMLKLMKDNDLIYHTNDGYFVSQKYIKKGKSAKQEED